MNFTHAMTIVKYNKDPKRNPSINPQYYSGINPQFNPSINPQYCSSINPQFNPSINPHYNSSINPHFNPRVNPQHHSSINPLHNPRINPHYNSSINPNINPAFEGLLFYTLDLELKEFIIQVNGEIIQFFDFDLNNTRFGVKHARNGYIIFSLDMEYTCHLESDHSRGYNYFDINNQWLGFAT